MAALHYGSTLVAAYLTLVSTTVAVTLITALSTLAGASISGYIASLISRNQNNAQTAIARNQQLEQRAVERRQIRRDAYLQFLNQLGVTEQILENLWQSEAPPTQLSEVNDFLRPARDAVSESRRVSDLVILEGPTDVSHIAMELGVRLTLEITDIVTVANAMRKKGVQTDKVLCREDEETFRKVMLKRSKLKLDFIVAAQKNLDDVSSLVAAPESKRGDTMAKPSVPVAD